MIAWGALWRKHDAIWDCRAARGAAAPQDLRTVKITCGRGVRGIAKRQQADAREEGRGNGKRLCLGGD